jgi:hypothetical protein
MTSRRWLESGDLWLVGRRVCALLLLVVAGCADGSGAARNPGAPIDGGDLRADANGGSDAPVAADDGGLPADDAAPNEAGLGGLQLDADGIVQSTVTVSGPGGSTLTIFRGTKVAVIAAGQDPAPPAAGQIVELALTDARQASATLPVGVLPVAGFRVVLTVGGQEVEAQFWPTQPPPPQPSSGAVDLGLKLVIELAQGTVDDGTRGFLWEVTSSGATVPVGTSPVYGDPQMKFNPDSTGDMQVGKLPAPAPPGSGVPAGLYWASYTVSVPSCLPVGQTQVCDPTFVDRVELVEASTQEIVALCWFQGSDVATSPGPTGSEFWCQRSQLTGTDTQITVASPQANLLTIHAWVLRQSDRLAFWDVYVPPSGGLNAPDGTVLADPYQDSKLKFAGFKDLTFTAKTQKNADFANQKALQPLLDAGYSARIRRFESTASGMVAEISVYDTLDARVLMEEQVITKNGWKVKTDPASTTGNRGTYEYTGKLTVLGGMGIDLMPDYRLANETPVGGTIMVGLDGQPNTDAKLTVNGVDVPPNTGLPGFYDLSAAALTIGPGVVVTLEATHPDIKDPVSISVECPPPFDITSPADGSSIGAAPLTVTWSPGVAIVPSISPEPAPVAGQYLCRLSNGSSSRMGTGDWFVKLASGQTEATLTNVLTSCKESVIEVRTSSDMASDADGNTAICYLHKRVHQLGP